tara:strand:+ start:4699 stop:4806 length:108 start_codon:yes stop_codon:yes gene_type:complete
MTRSLDLGTPGGLTVAVKECLAIEGRAAVPCGKAT